MTTGPPVGGPALRFPARYQCRKVTGTFSL